MAGRGPAPKDPSTRRRRNTDSTPRTAVGADGRVRGSRLPDFGGGELGWHPQTVHWWETWRRSAQAKAFTAVDWAFMLDTAALHSQMWHGEWKLAAEVRLRVAKFGATLEDRARLRLDVETPAQARARTRAAAANAKSGGATVTPIESRRSRLADD